MLLTCPIGRKFPNNSEHFDACMYMDIAAHDNVGPWDFHYYIANTRVNMTWMCLYIRLVPSSCSDNMICIFGITHHKHPCSCTLYVLLQLRKCYLCPSCLNQETEHHWKLSIKVMNMYVYHTGSFSIIFKYLFILCTLARFVKFYLPLHHDIDVVSLVAVV